MFREVSRNKKQALSKERATEVLENCTSGVLSLVGDDGYAYGVPMSFRHKDGKLYFHSAMKGHKIDSINKHDRVSFTVIETDYVVPSEFTTYYRSAIAFGRIRLASGIEEKREALGLLVEKYSAGYEEESKSEIEGSIAGVQILVLDIEHLTGKEAIEFSDGRARSIKEVGKDDLGQAIGLVNRVFSEFVAVDYSEQGRKTFSDYLKGKLEDISADIISRHKKMWACRECGEIVGVIATRDVSHVSLMFVDKRHHRKGIARQLMSHVLEEIGQNGAITEMTVNSSPYAVKAYERLGFEKTGEQQEKDGIIFTPMMKTLTK
ncbi:MAG: GNAT family N-acetyltransferase [Clostridiales bacterium]|nr:GNAT family N-acetyltransferase [Clostridiales bacterium]